MATRQYVYKNDRKFRASFFVLVLINSFALFIASLFFEQLVVNSIFTCFVAGFLLTIFNRILKPILVVLTLPISILTLGLFYPLINVIILNLIDFMLPSFKIEGIFVAIGVSIVIAIINWIVTGIFDRRVNVDKNEVVILEEK